MQNYDYSWQSFGTGGFWNLSAPDSSDPLPVVVVSATDTEIRGTLSQAGNEFMGRITGQFSFEEPLTDVRDLSGTITSWELDLNGTPRYREQFPEGTLLKAWEPAGLDYAYKLSILSGNDYFVGSVFRHDQDHDGVQAGDGNDTFVGNSSSKFDDEFYGEAGIDTAVYRGKISEYQIERSDSIWDSRLDDGTVTTGYIVTDLVSFGLTREALIDSV